MSRNAAPRLERVLRDIQKMAVMETQLQCTFSLRDRISYIILELFLRPGCIFLASGFVKDRQLMVNER